MVYPVSSKIMPAPIPSEVKQRAMALLAQSKEATVYARCTEVFNKLLEEGHPVGLSTLRHWASPSPLSSGPSNSRANRTGNVTNVEENIQAIKQYLEDHDHQVSIREISSALQLSRSSVHRILQSEGLHPYKCVEVQALSDAAKAQRAEFCNFMLCQIDDDPHYHRRIIFTDETSVGEPKLNHQNDRVWSESQPYEFREHRRLRQKAMAFSGMNYYLGVLPVFWVESTLNALSYMELLHSEVVPHLSDVTGPNELRDYYIYQHDGAPAHISWPSIVLLHQTFDNIISKNSDIPWPPYSPDLNPCDYYLWSRAKQEYLSSPDIQNHKMAFENKMADIPLQECQNAIDDFPRRLQMCLGAEGGHFLE